MKYELVRADPNGREGPTELVEADSVTVSQNGAVHFYDRLRMVCGYTAGTWLLFRKVEG